MNTLRLYDSDRRLRHSPHWTRTIFGSLLSAIAVAYASPSIAEVATAESLKAVVMVEQSVTVVEPQLLDATVQTTPSAIVNNKAGTTPSRLIKKLYGVRRNKAPEAYDILESKVLELNGIHDARL